MDGLQDARQNVVAVGFPTANDAFWAQQEAALEDMDPEMIAAMVEVQDDELRHTDVNAWKQETFYSDKYDDDVFEFRRVTVPRAMTMHFPRTGRTMTDPEWRRLGIVMSRGWEHYDIHSPEMNVLLFRRPRGTDGRTGEVPESHKVVVMSRKLEIRRKEVQRTQFFTTRTD